MGTQNKINLKWSNWSEKIPPVVKHILAPQKDANNHLVKLQKKWIRVDHTLPPPLFLKIPTFFYYFENIPKEEFSKPSIFLDKRYLIRIFSVKASTCMQFSVGKNLATNLGLLLVSKNRDGGRINEYMGKQREEQMQHHKTHSSEKE